MSKEFSNVDFSSREEVMLAIIALMGESSRESNLVLLGTAMGLKGSPKILHSNDREAS